MTLRTPISKILEKLYEYDSMRSLKDFVRPFKHFVLGRDDIYWVVELVKQARGNDEMKVIFDVGAAVGDKTITFAKVFPSATIYCFEPQPESIARLQRRTRRWRDRIRIFDIGLSNFNGTADFFIFPYKDSSSLLPHTGIKGTKVEKIAVKRLDDVIAEQGINYIDFLKIDVEGAEKQVLEGGGNALANKIGSIFLEIVPQRHEPRTHHYIDIFQMLYGAGFSFLGVYGDYFFSKDPAVIKRYYEIAPP